MNSSPSLPTDSVLASYKLAWQTAKMNPSFFIAAQAAQDAILIRKALGIHQWNVYGWSYGTNVALEPLRRDVSAIRSFIIDAVKDPLSNTFSQYRFFTLTD